MRSIDCHGVGAIDNALALRLRDHGHRICFLKLQITVSVSILLTSQKYITIAGNQDGAVAPTHATCATYDEAPHPLHETGLDVVLHLKILIIYKKEVK